MDSRDASGIQPDMDFLPGKIDAGKYRQQTSAELPVKTWRGLAATPGFIRQGRDGSPLRHSYTRHAGQVLKAEARCHLDGQFLKPALPVQRDTHFAS